jgi:hypothetical protein
MALHVTVRPQAKGTHLRIEQTGYEEGDRWRRYYDVIGHGWSRALAGLKSLLEK